MWPILVEFRSAKSEGSGRKKRQKIVGCTDSSDLGHFGMSEVSAHFGTILKSKTKHTAYPKAYPSVSENNFKFNPSGLYRAALSHGGELQSLVLTMSGSG